MSSPNLKDFKTLLENGHEIEIYIALDHMEHLVYDLVMRIESGKEKRISEAVKHATNLRRNINFILHALENRYKIPHPHRHFKTSYWRWRNAWMDKFSTFSQDEILELDALINAEPGVDASSLLKFYPEGLEAFRKQPVIIGEEYPSICPNCDEHEKIYCVQMLKGGMRFECGECNYVWTQDEKPGMNDRVLS